MEELGERGMLPEAAHSVYLGYELFKAETALSIGRTYVQDRPLFDFGRALNEEGEN